MIFRRKNPMAQLDATLAEHARVHGERMEGRLDEAAIRRRLLDIADDIVKVAAEMERKAQEHG